MAASFEKQTGRTVKPNATNKVYIIFALFVFLILVLNLSIFLKTESIIVTTIIDDYEMLKLPGTQTDHQAGIQSKTGMSDQIQKKLTAKLGTLMSILSIVNLFSGAMVMGIVLATAKKLLVIPHLKNKNRLNELINGAKQLFARSCDAALLVGKMKDNVDVVYNSVKEIDHAGADVCGFVEKLANVNGKLTQSSESARKMLDDALCQIEQDSSRLTKVSNAAQKTDHLMMLISKISQEIDLLAVTTQIEMSRAGENGDKLSTVLDEINEMAWQAAEEVEEINRYINEVQTVAAESDETAGISQNLAVKIHQILMAMSADLKDQSASSLEMLDKVRQILKVIEYIFENINLIKSVMNDMDERISDVNQFANQLKKSTF